ncbi:MAG: PAS domain S-box protein [bacterium]|nr:PAS domain S-box protein [bacterium]
MNMASLPAIVLAGIAIAVGLYHTFIFVRRRDHRVDLSFALVCATIVLYDVFCAALYSADTPEIGVEWQHMQIFALSLGAVILVQFVHNYTRRLSGWATVIFAIAYSPLIVAALAGHRFLWTDTPSIKIVQVPFAAKFIIYNEMAAGQLTIYQSVLGLAFFATIFVAGVRQYRSGDPRRAIPLLLALTVFSLGVLNDAAVSTGLYSSIYLIEYTFLALIGLMAYSLSGEMLRAAIIEEALDTSESRFKAIVETTNDWIWEVDSQMRYTYSSPRVEDMLGFSPSEIIGRTPFDLMTPEEAKRVHRYLQRTVGPHSPITMLEKVNLNNEGREVVLETSGTPIIDAGGEFLGYRGIDRDITEHKKAFEALMESEERFRTLAENVPGVIYLCQCDEHRTMLFLNDAIESLSGYSKDEFLEERLSLVDLIHPDDSTKALDELAKAVEASRQFTLQYRLRHSDGSWRWIEEVGLPVHHDPDKLLLEGYLSDITARQHAEDALRESEERYRNLVLASPSAILLLTATGTILFANPAAVSLLGGNIEDDLVGHHIADFTPGDMQRSLEQRLHSVLDGSSPSLPFEETFQRLNGDATVVAGSSVRVLSDGQPAILLVGTDITASRLAAAEKERLESQLRHAQKMEAVGRLAGGVAHDFNNLLQAILSHTEALSRLRNQPQRLAEGLAELNERTRQGAQLTRQLLLFSRRESTRPERINLNEVVEETARLVTRLLREQLQLELDFSSDTLPIVADRGQLEQVVMNLALNAADASPDGGTVTIRTGRDDDRVWFEVSDAGPGIPPEIREQVFEPFFTTKPPGEGSGLGLSVVHGIVSAHGGDIELQSDRYRGTTFKVAFVPEDSEPSGPRVPIVEPKQLDPDTVGRNRRILLVEDDPATREALKSILEILGFTIEPVSCGAEANELAEEISFDLLLTDFLLPDCRGNDLATELQAQQPDLPVILMSGYTQDATVRDDVASGKMAFLQKPFDMDRLAQELSNALDGE